jgi:hypothetical protein
MTNVDYSKHVAAAYIDEAVADGWTVSVGPWGSREDDNTVILRREVPELDGYFNIWAVDRAMGFPGQKAVLDRHISGWFVEYTEGDFRADREQALNLKPTLLSEEYDMNVFLSAANKCPQCGIQVPANQLTGVSFASAACDVCLPAARQRLEPAGWYN